MKDSGQRTADSKLKHRILCCLLSAVCCLSWNILAQTPPPDTKKDAPPPQDSGIRKLGRRERKEKIAALPEKYRQFLQDVEPIIMPTEIDTFLILETDPQREIYITEFWRRRDVAQGTTNHAFRDEYYNRLDEAKARFKYLSSDRSRMYLIHGEPEELIKTDCSRLLQPLEIWKYTYIPGMGHEVRMLFYMPRNGIDYRLWNPMGDQNDALAELVSVEVMGVAGADRRAIQQVFYESARRTSSSARSRRTARTATTSSRRSSRCSRTRPTCRRSSIRRRSTRKASARSSNRSCSAIRTRRSSRANSPSAIPASRAAAPTPR